MQLGISFLGSRQPLQGADLLGLRGCGVEGGDGGGGGCIGLRVGTASLAKVGPEVRGACRALLGGCEGILGGAGGSKGRGGVLWGLYGGGPRAGDSAGLGARCGLFELCAAVLGGMAHCAGQVGGLAALVLEGAHGALPAGGLGGEGGGGGASGDSSFPRSSLGTDLGVRCAKLELVLPCQ